MHYLNTLLAVLALVAYIDARAVEQKVHRRYQNAGAIPIDTTPSCPFSSSGDSAATNPEAVVAEMAAAAATAAAASSPTTDAKSAASPVSPGANARAIYFMTNQDENSIIMLPVQEDGTLTTGSIIATGGKGASLIDPMTGEPVQTDTLASQGSVRVIGNSLFAVNAGSNTLSMFAIDPEDPAKLAPVGQPVETGGDVSILPPSSSPYGSFLFPYPCILSNNQLNLLPLQFPTSIATSTLLQTICVGHTGLLSGITCAKFDPTSGLSAFDTLRPFSLNQTNPPTGPLNGIGTTFFNQDSTALITTIKGNPMDPSGAFPGFISLFPIDSTTGTIAQTDSRTTPNGTAVLFGSVIIPDTNTTTTILATDASFGSLSIDLPFTSDLTNPSAQLSNTVLATTNLPNQIATCWAAISPVTDTAFLTDVAVNHLVEVDLQNGEVLADLRVENSHPGMLDLQATPSGMIYALAPGNGTEEAGVVVFDVKGGRGKGRVVQDFRVAGLDNRGMGMAFMV